MKLCDRIHADSTITSVSFLSCKKEEQMKEVKTGKIAVNREYKSAMFCMIFRDREKLLELYNAVSGSSYSDSESLEVVTLENAIYMNMKNDMAFLVDMHLNLYEHQSTFNPNMPLRDLLYVAREYQKLVYNTTVYTSVLLKIPTPRFIVFYNGREIRPGKEVLRLSDVYFCREDDPDLELKVTVLNINEGNNRELLEQCRTLKEYMQYVTCVRRYHTVSGMELEEAVDKAVTECIENGILSDFLRRNRAEAMSISIFEYNEAEEMEKIRKVEYSVGEADGFRRGIQQGIQAVITCLLEAGLSEQVIVEKLSKNFELTEEEAEACLKNTGKGEAADTL